jgi:dTDP-glucose 4,6-dehydratase
VPFQARRNRRGTERMKILVTGGAGFIGSALVRRLIGTTDTSVVVVDKLGYAASLDALASVAASPRFSFERADVGDAAAMARIFAGHRPDAVMHLAAETHVDRSIDGPCAFVATNALGTAVLLEATRAFWTGLDAERRERFRFHHVSTDEVFGALGPSEPPFTEGSPYAPRSPYAASKAAADHLVRAFAHTWGLPAIVTASGNNFGPFQFPEKLVPLTILNALEGSPIAVYGEGANMRDWLHVEDHVEALLRVLDLGTPGETYLFGGGGERSNLSVVEAICDLVDELVGQLPNGPRRRLIRFVADRPGHDFRYAADTAKAARDLGWRPRHDFSAALRETVAWYLDSRAWWAPLRARYAGERLGAPIG